MKKKNETEEIIIIARLTKVSKSIILLIAP
jgi:hypothetical protein